MRPEISAPKFFTLVWSSDDKLCGSGQVSGLIVTVSTALVHACINMRRPAPSTATDGMRKRVA
jgi:hypothetical protein